MGDIFFFMLHSSETVERVFSTINRIKTKLRNRLSTKTITEMLHTKRSILNCNCHALEISKEMLKRMYSEIYCTRKTVRLSRKQQLQHFCAAADDDIDE